MRLVALHLVLMSLFAAARLADAADPKNDRLAFTAMDTCSKTSFAVEYRVKAKGNKAYVEVRRGVQDGSAAQNGAPTCILILDFANATIKQLFPKSKTYFSVPMAGLSALPVNRMIYEFRAKDPKDFEANKDYTGTLVEMKTVKTALSGADKNATFKDDVFAVPKGYNQQPEPTTGGVSLGGMSVGPYDGSGAAAAGANLPGIGR